MQVSDLYISDNRFVQTMSISSTWFTAYAAGVDLQFKHDYYCKKISSKTGISIDYSNDLNKYSHFLEVRKTCDKLDVDYFTYIEAQFESLSWRNGIPEPSMLNGEKAIERLNKFIYETGSSVKKKSKESVKSLKNLKNIK